MKLEVPIFSPPVMEVECDRALVFGTVERRAIIKCDTVVYDPQNPSNPSHFTENGSTCKRCALVLNHNEAMRLANTTSLFEAVKFLQKSILGKGRPYTLIVVKMAHAGCWVCTESRIESIPAYATNQVFSIGSGDVFSASFYAKWALEDCDAVTSADVASKVTAQYCNDGAISSRIKEAFSGVVSFEALPLVIPTEPIKKKQIYLAGPFFSQGELALIEHLKSSLESPWTEVFSPFHRVGFGAPKDIYQPDINGLEKSDIIFGVLTGMDPGTIFEIGYAANMKKPIFCLAESVNNKDLSMFIGYGATIESDVASAIYKTLWQSMK
ncbi:nucleoside 2-deoxyribosyltransferase [Luteolibacter pohnpeiensis]|uniref:Nucleoside 2-deoxyribosyltransferase n=1 Tax=Luteolibacter pohnpeiensis TaxID=454153 RepID=A0A934VYJ5_9BACT|nr:PfkB family carbohydrate kinase [Luteolibacter pohnpeiensis]MBK1884584.1 nucleoside 2-deoxyribosyltransferase [Luteolibacter pohnpeiensis]